MSIHEPIIYKGRVYRVAKRGSYYACGEKAGLDTQFLHRHIWVDLYGPIPEKHHIHHKNGNPLDNRIENLECLSAAAHMSGHSLERLSDPVYRKAHLDRFKKVQDAARVWPSSEEGRKWSASEATREMRSKARKKSWKSRFWDKPCTCLQCGGEFLGLFGRAKFCSPPCCTLYWKLVINQKMCTCQVCEKVFQTSKQNAGYACSKTCQTKLQHKNKKLVVAQPTNY